MFIIKDESNCILSDPYCDQKYLSLLAFVLTTALLISVPVQANPASAPSSPIRIGFVCPLTGASSDFGNSARLGAELAVAEINQVGGFLGRPIELLARNDKADPAEGTRVAEELVERDRVALTVGYCNTGVALRALEVFQRNKSVLIVPMATGSAVTTTFPPQTSYIFRMAARDSDIAPFLVDEVVQRANVRKIAIFADRSAYGEGGLRNLEQYLRDKGIQPVYVARFDIGIPSLVEEMKIAKSNGAQAVIGYTLAAEFATILKAKAEARFAGTVFGPHPLSFSTVLETAAEASEGSRMAVTIIRDTSNERRSSFMVRLRQHAKAEKISSLMAAAQTYDAVHLGLRAMLQSRGDTSGIGLKAALEDLRTPYRGVVTTHEKPFSPNDHDAFTKNMLWLGAWHKDDIVFAHSDDAKKSAVLRTKSGR